MSRVTNYTKPHVPERHHDLALDVSQMTGCSGQLIILPWGASGELAKKQSWINVLTFMMRELMLNVWIDLHYLHMYMRQVGQGL